MDHKVYGKFNWHDTLINLRYLVWDQPVPCSRSKFRCCFGPKPLTLPSGAAGVRVQNTPDCPLVAQASFLP